MKRERERKWERAYVVYAHVSSEIQFSTKNVIISYCYYTEESGGLI